MAGYSLSLSLRAWLFLVCGGCIDQTAIDSVRRGGRALLVGFVPQVNGPLAKVLDRIRQPSPKARRLATIAIWLFSSWSSSTPRPARIG